MTARFSLTDVPPGDYTLMAWHPGVGTVLEKKVTVPAKGTAQVDFVFDSPKGRRSAHEIEENPHFGPDRSARRWISGRRWNCRSRKAGAR